MKKYIIFILIILIFLINQNIIAQNVGINSTGAAPASSAGLDINFTDKGVLIPRVNIADLSTAAPVTSATTSIIVYNTNSTTGLGYYYWDSSKWVKLFDANGGKVWLLAGNPSTTPGTDFVGTTDAQDLVFKTNNSERVRILSSGNVGIGVSNPLQKLHVTDDIVMGAPSDGSSTADGQAEGVKIWNDHSAWYFGADRSNDEGSVQADENFFIGHNDDSDNEGLFNIQYSGLIGVGTTSPTHRLNVEHTSTTTDRGAVYGSIDNSGGTSYGLLGYNTDDISGTTRQIGVYGNSGAGANNMGVAGRYDANKWGALGISNWGVYGVSNSTSGAGVGGIGSGTIGVYGYSNAATGSGYCGVQGYNDNATGDGIIGLGSGTTLYYTSSNGDGVIGCTDNASGYGIIGAYHDGSDGDRFGTVGSANYGVYGQVSSTIYGYLGGNTNSRGVQGTNGSVWGFLGGVNGAYGSDGTNAGAFGTGTYGAYVWGNTYFDTDGGTHDAIMNNLAGQVTLAPLVDYWGYIGTSSYRWWRGYANSWVSTSQRKYKRNIIPVEDDLYKLIIDDIDKIKPSFYKFKEETDEMEEGNEHRYRPNFHLGVITDESPDYVQDETFSGIEGYALATLSLAGVKYNRQEIKEIKAQITETNKTIQDFGSNKITKKSVWIKYSKEFKEKLNGSVPVVIITPNSPNSSLYIAEKDDNGFRIASSSKMKNNIIFDWVAYAKVEMKNSRKDNKAYNISPKVLDQIIVSKKKKRKINAYWKTLKQDKPENLEMPKQEKIKVSVKTNKIESETK